MLPGMAVHVVHRGNNRTACFFEDGDWAFYLFHLGRLLPRAACRLHAYCLMTNHVHLLLTSATIEGCASLMKGVAQLHSQYINKKRRRTGYLWEGRYKSCLVQSEEYVLACYRYIELNPVRAGLVRRPVEYRWSSYACNAIGTSCELITPHEQYVGLGRDPAERQAVYRDLFGSLLGTERVEQIRTATNGGYALGTPEFKQAISRAVGRRVQKGVPGRPARTAPSEDQLDLF